MNICCNTTKIRVLVATVSAYICLSLGSMGPTYAAGEFELNFQPRAGFEMWNYDDRNHVGNANSPNINHTGTIEGTFDGPFDETPMIYEMGTVNGQRYIHQVIGDPAAGFAMEIYIKVVGGGGRDMGPVTFEVMDSGGSVGDTVAPDCSNNWYFNGTGPCSGNNADPLRANDPDFTGSGTGNPTSVEMRMVMGGSWDALTSTWSCDAVDCSEFIKDELNKKPKITHKIIDDELNSEFIVDMSGLDYASTGIGFDSASEVAFSNIQTITGPNAYGTEGDFSMVSIAGSDNVAIVVGSGIVSAGENISTSVTAGRYTFTPGAGWNVGYTVYERGVYSYDDGGFDHTGVSWIDYCDATQNASLCVPWKDMVWQDRNGGPAPP